MDATASTDVVQINTGSEIAQPNQTKLNISSVISNGINFLVPFGTLLAVGGQVVVHSFIATYGNIHTYQIVSTQFLTSGFGFVIATLLALATVIIVGTLWYSLYRLLRKLAKKILPSIYKPQRELTFHWRILNRLGWIFVLPASLIVAGFALVLGISLAVTNFFIGAMLYAAVTGLIFDLLLFLIKPKVFQDARAEGLLDFSITIGLIAIYAILLGNVYANSIYRIIPRSLTGGQPIVAEIVSPDLTSVGIEQSEPICILAELGNGILIFQPATNKVTAIQTDVIYSFSTSNINCSSPQPN